MRAAIYNRFWHSQGGGERHSGMLAQVLAENGWDVDLVGHTDVDRDELAEHVGIDLSRTHLRIEPDIGDRAVEEISADYELFVNASYMSRIRSRAARSVYLCYFPTPFDHDLAGWQRGVLRRVGGRMSRIERIFEFGTGWFPPEGGRRRSWAWTSGDAILVLPPGVPHVLSLELGRPGAPAPVELDFVDQHGSRRAGVIVEPRFSRHLVDLGDGADGLEIHLQSDTFTPSAADPRSLGVAVSRISVGGHRLSAQERVGYRLPWLLRNPGDLRFLADYRLVLANSEYTRGWIDRYWHVPSEVLFPPVKTTVLQPAAERTKTILSIGRFFAPGHGHSKRQLELVQFFGDLVRSGRLRGWKLHVIGGLESSQQAYFRSVQAAAAGLPVTLSPNAPRSVVNSELATASIFWTATGYGQDEQRTPWTMEHFGITTAEAMAGGCVPVVIDKAGQREIVRDGVDGFRWATVRELHAKTLLITEDEALRRRLSAAAIARAQSYSEQAFAARWTDIADRYGLHPSSPARPPT